MAQQLPFNFSPDDDLDALILESVRYGLDPVSTLHEHLGGQIDWSWCRSKVLTVVVRELRLAYYYSLETGIELWRDRDERIAAEIRGDGRKGETGNAKVQTP